MTLICSSEMSPSDPHIMLDYPSDKIVSLINLNHPYWEALELTDPIPLHLKGVVDSESWFLAFLEMRADESGIAFMYRIRRVN